LQRYLTSYLLTDTARVVLELVQENSTHSLTQVNFHAVGNILRLSVTFYARYDVIRIIDTRINRSC